MNHSLVQSQSPAQCTDLFAKCLGLDNQRRQRLSNGCLQMQYLARLVLHSGGELGCTRSSTRQWQVRVRMATFCWKAQCAYQILLRLHGRTKCSKCTEYARQTNAPRSCNTFCENVKYNYSIHGNLSE